MGNFWKKKESIVFFAILFFIISFLIYIAYKDNDSSAGFYSSYDAEVLSSDWLFDKDGESQYVSIPNEFDVKADDIASIHRVLPATLKDGTALCFKTKNTSVSVLVENEEIYSFGWDKEEFLGDSPGSIWNVVDLKEEYAGKKLTIFTSSHYSLDSGKFSTVVMGDKSDVILYILRESFVKFFLSCIPLVLGFILIVIVPFIKNTLNSKPFFYAGIFLIIVGIWEVTESEYMQFLFDKAFTSQMVNYLAFGFLPVAIIMGFNAMNMIKKHFSEMFFANVIVYLVFILLQLLDIADFTESVWIIHAVVVIDGVKVFRDTFECYNEMKIEKASFIPVAISFVLILVASVVDIYRFYVIPNSNNGAFFRGAMVFFIVTMSISVVYTALSMQKNNAEKETIINMAYTDALTGIRNRRCFEEDTEKLVKDKINFTVVAADMNNLKKINDELGHKYGDEALSLVANGLKKFDELGEKSYRMGGDEFNVVCTNISLDQIEETCQLINKELNKKEYFPGEPLEMAYGYFRFSATTDKEIYRVLAQADKKMYEKKMKMKEERRLMKEKMQNASV